MRAAALEPQRRRARFVRSGRRKQADFVEALINRGAAHMALKHNAEALKDFGALIASIPQMPERGTIAAASCKI